MSALTDLPPPSSLIKHLCTRHLVEPDARFETLYGGRTNQVWKVLGGAGDTVLKLYRAGFQNPLFRNDANLEASCLNALKDTGFVPNLRASGRFEAVNWVIYDHAPGTPWRSGVADVAHLLRRVHQSQAALNAPKGVNGSRELHRHTLEILSHCSASRRNELMRWQPENSVEPLALTHLIHGDPVAGNILRSAQGLTLIDWQCPAMGDPCEDLGMFLSPAMQAIYRGTALSAEEQSEFLNAYGLADRVDRYRRLRPWFAWRMASYCLWRLENGAPDYAVGLDLELTTLQT